MIDQSSQVDLDALVEEIEEAIEVHEGHCVSYVSFCPDIARRFATAITSLRNQLTASEARERELEAAIQGAAEWFEEYADQHSAKAENASDDDERASRKSKAVRNAERAALLRAVLAPPHTMREVIDALTNTENRPQGAAPKMEK